MNCFYMINTCSKECKNKKGKARELAAIILAAQYYCMMNLRRKDMRFPLVECKIAYVKRTSFRDEEFRMKYSILFW